MTPFITHRNRTVRIDNTGLIENALARTYLGANIAAASGALTVKSISGFAVGKYVWINPYSETSEIIAVHASTTPTGTTVTLAANTVYAHGAGEEVYYIDSNQIEVSHAATLAGAKTPFTAFAVDPSEKSSTYLDTTQTTGFYFARFKDSVAATFGGYSDGIAYGGWADSAVGSLVDRALKELGISLSEKVTVNDCLDWLNEGMRFIQGKLKRWPEHYSYNEIVGQAQRGTNVITMPTTAYDTETARSILAVRVGDNKQLIYLEPNEFDAQLEGVTFTQVRTQAVATDTTLAVDNSYDFLDSGTLHAYISGALDSFTYTGVTRDDASGATADFTGIPASGDASIENTLPVDTYIWQNEVEGIPTYYTVRNGNLEYWPLADATEDNANVYMDYAKVATSVDSQIDTIDYQRYDMLFYYLVWRMEARDKNSGELNMRSGWYTQFKEALNDAIRTLPTIPTKMKPDINRMSRRGGGKASLQDLPIDIQ